MIFSLLGSVMFVGGWIGFLVLEQDSDVNDGGIRLAFGILTLIFNLLLNAMMNGYLMKKLKELNTVGFVLLMVTILAYVISWIIFVIYKSKVGLAADCSLDNETDGDILLINVVGLILGGIGTIAAGASTNQAVSDELSGPLKVISSLWVKLSPLACSMVALSWGFLAVGNSFASDKF